MTEKVFTMFSDISFDFDGKYKNDRNFKQRWQCWSEAIDRYTKPGDAVYDLGCGPGVFSFYAASAGARVTGFDGSPGMINLCNEKLAQTRGEKHLDLRFVQDTLPLERSAMIPAADLIICSSMFEYIKEKDKMIACFSDLLKEEGLLLLSVQNRNSVYRFFEKVSYRIFGKPAYLEHVYNTYTYKELVSEFGRHRFEAMEKHYYADNYLFSFLPKLFLQKEYYTNLLLVVFQKRKSV